MKLRHVFRASAELDEGARARMLELMHLCYDNVDDARFRAELDTTQHVICLLDANGILQGFATIRIAEEALDERRVDVLWTGDTIVHPDWWGSKALQSAFLSFTMRHKLKAPLRPLYWLLTSKGYKTYLMLANNFPTAFPRRGYAPPLSLVDLRDRVARAWWGGEYDPKAELVRFTVPRDRVKPGVAALDTATLAHPHVAYFLERNPRWADGDELMCLAEIDFALAARWCVKQVRRWCGLAPRPGEPPRPAISPPR